MSNLFSFISTHQVHTTKAKVIPCEEFSTLLDASQIIAKAKEDADAYKAKVKEECKKLKKQAKDEGYQEGLVLLNKQIIGLDEEKKRLRHEMNKVILPLTLKAAKKIVGSELQTSPETIVSIVRQALVPVMESSRITIYVNKADKEILDGEKNSLKETLEQIQTLVVKEREDISRGGCIIETETGIINATLENQWTALESAFKNYWESLKQTQLDA